MCGYYIFCQPLSHSISKLIFLKNVLFFIIAVAGIFIFINFQLNDFYGNARLSKLNGLLTEIIGGIIFLVFLILVLKPSLGVCLYIAEIPASPNEPAHLRFKIVNYSLFRAYDIHIYVFHKERSNVSGCDITTSLIGSYEASRKGVSYLQSAVISMFEDAKTNAAQFRLGGLVGEDQKIRDILSSHNSYLGIHVYLRNG